MDRTCFCCSTKIQQEQHIFCAFSSIFIKKCIKTNKITQKQHRAPPNNGKNKEKSTNSHPAHL